MSLRGNNTQADEFENSYDGPQVVILKNLGCQSIFLFPFDAMFMF
jgi:hypothetical protein